MRGKMLVGALCCGAVLGTAVAAAIVPCCSDKRYRRKMKRYKSKMAHTVGTVLDAVSNIKS